MKLKTEKWCIIHYGGADAIVTIDNHDPNKFHWSGGFSWATFHDGDTYVVKEYGYYEEGDPDIDNLFLDFYKNYNVPVSYIAQTAGWLAPEGKYYPCDYWQHNSFATSLAAIYYDSLEGTKELERKGWIRVYDNGYLGMRHEDNFEATQDQINTIQDILSSPKNPNEEYGKNLKDGLRIILRDYDFE